MVQTCKRHAARRPRTPKAALACCGPIDRLLDAELFRALGDTRRVAIVACLAKCGRACTVGEIAECCSVDLSVVSRHLAVLAGAGVLESGKQGRQVLYRVRFQSLSSLLRRLADAIDACRCDGNAGGCGCVPNGGSTP
ncbi:MAG: helix-turn-helix transcriptional regulator [Phycisphaerae bacterium]|nr:helix-turn-helix transcriptional regulator [Phycisphaerae bacterium]